MHDLIAALFQADLYLEQWVIAHGFWIYIVLFGIFFIETGLVITPFLPGDSLLFAIGMVAAKGSISFAYVVPILVLAATLGDSLNYLIGSNWGIRFQGKMRFIKQSHIEKTQKFYDKHGGKTISIGRFIPIIRTFAPFVAGMAKMDYSRFCFYSAIGSIAWVGSIVSLGYFLGHVPIVNKLLPLVFLVVIALVILPLLIPIIRKIYRFALQKK